MPPPVVSVAGNCFRAARNMHLNSCWPFVRVCTARLGDWRLAQVSGDVVHLKSTTRSPFGEPSRRLASHTPPHLPRFREGWEYLPEPVRIRPGPPPKSKDQ